MKTKGCFFTLRIGPTDVDVLAHFIDVMAAAGFNTLCLELEKGMRYDSHPEISAPWALGKDTLHDVVVHAKHKGLDVVPLVPTLSHVNYITDAHPELLEEGSKIYCPSAAGVYDLVFDLLEEAIDLFEPTRLHIGHDEVLTSYDPRLRKSIFTCRECAPKKPWEVFADDVTTIHNYLARRNIKTMMWADGLLDPDQFAGRSFCQSGCYGGAPDYLCRSAELLPRDIIMCDWHYEPAREFPTVTYLQNKGFETLGCPNFAVNSFLFTDYACRNATDKFKGMLATAWCQINKRNARHLAGLIKQHGYFFSNPGVVPPGDGLRRNIKDSCARAGEPLPHGAFRKVYDFTIDGDGVYHSSGWRDLRYMEWPDSADPMTPPRHPDSLEVKASRAGFIEYDFIADTGRAFDHVSLKLWMKCPGTCRVLVKAKAGEDYLSVVENKEQRGGKIDITRHVKGGSRFTLRFEAENTTTKKVSFLRRFEIAGSTVQCGACPQPKLVPFHREPDVR